jgi:hypothetical protein
MLISGAGKSTLYRIVIILELFFSLPPNLQYQILEEINNTIPQDENGNPIEEPLTIEELRVIHTIARTLQYPEKRLLDDGYSHAIFIQFPFTEEEAPKYLKWAVRFPVLKYGEIEDSLPPEIKVYRIFRSIGVTMSSYIALKALFETYASTKVMRLIPAILSRVKLPKGWKA